MSRLRLLILTALVAAALAAGLPANTSAGGGGDNTAVAVNTKDGSSVFKFAFAVRHVMGDVVDTTNAAVAYASCTDCHTTAIAIEIVLVAGSPSTFTPTNEAIAINYQCTLCSTFAAAYQFVVQSAGPVHFTDEGNRELKDIRKAIRELQDLNLTPFELQAKLDPLIERLKTVLATQIVAAGDHGDESDGLDLSNGDQHAPQPPGASTTKSGNPGGGATATQTTPTGATDTTTTPTTSTTTDTTPTTTTGTTPTTTTP